MADSHRPEYLETDTRFTLEAIELVSVIVAAAGTDSNSAATLVSVVLRQPTARPSKVTYA